MVWKCINFLSHTITIDIETLRCPIRINNEIFKSEIAAPLVGQHNDEITKEYQL